MAYVFGDPIADLNITAFDRARVAIHKKNADGKDNNARSYLEKLKDEWEKESPNRVCTLVLIYNATGNTMTLAHIEDYDGHIGQAPYPIEIQNGQWGAFLHVQDQKGGASRARMAYRSEDLKVCHKLEWFSSTARHWVWAATRENPDTDDTWDNINENSQNTTQSFSSRYFYTNCWNGWLSTITTGGTTTPVVEATFTLLKNLEPANNA